MQRMARYSDIKLRIDSVDDALDAMELAKEFDVSLDNCKTVEQMKQRLMYKFTKLRGQMKDIRVLEESMTKIYQEDITNRSKLCILFSSLEQILNGIKNDRRLHRQLETEGIAENYKATIAKFLQVLRQDRCPIILAGETSAGKSSILNLFMREKVLPEKLLSCTSTICELEYADKRGARVLECDGQEKVIDFDDRARYIYKQTDRERRFQNHVGVRLHIPLAFLKSGITLVDTPGIGENNEMANVLLEYVTRNDVYGFIYVIKSDNAGGVAEDRLQNLLRKLLPMKNAFDQEKFDPRTAIFVCSRWDLVDDDQKEHVKQDTIRKLKSCWPRFDQSKQLFFMDTEFAWHTAQDGYITDDYAKLIEAIEVLLPMGLQRKLSLAYWWLEHVMLRSFHPLRALMNRTQQPQSKVKEMKLQAACKLEKIKEDLEAFLKSFNKTLTEHVTIATRNLSTFLKSPEAAKQMTTWKSRDVPPIGEFDTWVLIKESFEGAINLRLASVIKDWEKENHIMQRMYGLLAEFAVVEMGNIRDKLESVEKIIRSNISVADPELSSSLKKVRESKGLLQTPGAFQSKEFFTQMRLKASSYGLVTYQKKTRLQAAFDALLVAPFRRRSPGHKRYSSSLSDQETFRQFNSDKTGYLSQLSGKVLSGVCEGEEVKEILLQELEAITSYVADIRENTPKVIAANEDLIAAMVSESQKKAQTGYYHQLFKQLCLLLDDSLEFSFEAVKEYNVSKNDVSFEQLGAQRWSRLSEYAGQLSGGIFASYRVGELKGSQLSPGTRVTVKRYRRAYAKADIFFEERNIRHLGRRRDPRQASLIGCMMDSPAGLPALVFKGILRSARQHYQSSTAALPGRTHHWRQSTDFLEGVMGGLVFLYFNRLVHMELSMDSIMVDEVGSAKLTNLGEARRLNLDKNVKMGPAEGFVYIPPEVLRGETLYTHSSDVYSVGLLIWELWNQKEVLVEYKKDTLLNFTEKSKNVYEILDKFTRVSTRMCKRVDDIFKHCVSKGELERPTVAELLDIWHPPGEISCDTIV